MFRTTGCVYLFPFVFAVVGELHSSTDNFYIATEKSCPSPTISAKAISLESTLVKLPGNLVEFYDNKLRLAVERFIKDKNFEGIFSEFNSFAYTMQSNPEVYKMEIVSPMYWASVRGLVDEIRGCILPDNIAQTSRLAMVSARYVGCSDTLVSRILLAFNPSL
jgi:hypothetical protein